MAAVLRDMKQFIGVDPHLPREQPQLEHANDHRGKADPRKKEENKDEQVGRGGGPVALGSTASGRQHPDMLPCNAARLFLQAPYCSSSAPCLCACNDLAPLPEQVEGWRMLRREYLQLVKKARRNAEE